MSKDFDSTGDGRHVAGEFTSDYRVDDATTATASFRVARSGDVADDTRDGSEAGLPATELPDPGAFVDPEDTMPPDVMRAVMEQQEFLARALNLAERAETGLSPSSGIFDDEPSEG